MQERHGRSWRSQGEIYYQNVFILYMKFSDTKKKRIKRENFLICVGRVHCMCIGECKLWINFRKPLLLLSALCPARSLSEPEACRFLDTLLMTKLQQLFLNPQPSQSTGIVYACSYDRLFLILIQSNLLFVLLFVLLLC